MKKSLLNQSHSVVGFSLVMLAIGSFAHAQKPDSADAKSSAPRTTTSDVIVGAPPSLPPAPPPVASGNQPAVPAIVGNSPTASQPVGNSPVPGTVVPGTTSTQPGVTTTGPSGPGVNGTSNQPNGVLGKKTSVGGVNNSPKGKGGKRVGTGTTDGVQTSQVDSIVGSSGKTVGSGAPSSPCEEEALQQIYKLLQEDGSNVVSTLYELTSRRLAIRALDHGSDSLEAMARSGVKDLEAKVKAIKNSSIKMAKMQSIYKVYGKPTDLSKIKSDLDAAKGKAKVACYWTNFSNNQRIKNDEASAYVLALTVGEKNSGLSDLDAATIWTMEKVRKAAALTDPDYQIGGANGNLMNISTRVARYLGKIGKGRNATRAELEDEISKGQRALDEAFVAAYGKQKAALQACLTEHYQDCADCAAKAEKKFESQRLNFDKIQRGLLQAVSEGENVKMESALKAKMGDVVFDLSDFAEGVVPEDARKHVSKVDACGNRVAKRSAVAKPAAVAAELEQAREPAAAAPAPADSTVVPAAEPKFPIQYKGPDAAEHKALEELKIE